MRIFGRLRPNGWGRRKRADAGLFGVGGPASSGADAVAVLAELFNAKLAAANRYGFTRGELAMLTRLLEMWPNLTEQFTSSVEFAFVDGERAGREEGGDTLGRLAHRDAVGRTMDTYRAALAGQGDVLRTRLNTTGVDDGNLRL